MYKELHNLLFAREFQELEERFRLIGSDRIHKDPYNNLLPSACFAEDAVDLVEWLLAHGFEPNATAVTNAIGGDNEAVVVSLLMKSMSEDEINFKNAQGESIMVP